MPVFTEYATTSRELRVLPSFAAPLPRLTPAFSRDNEQTEKYEVVIIGAGPAGLMLQLLLSRYGLSDDSLLCVDAKPSILKSGQADGIQPRTLEVLKSLGIVDEIITDGCHMEEVAFWNPSSNKDEVIERTSIVRDVSVPARFQYEVTIHQGRIERILETDLLRYSKRGVQRNTRLLDAKIDEAGDAEFPVVAELEIDGQRRTVRTKHLVGADGARSNVRRAMGLQLVGESTDHIWGVMDLVVDTDFPDIRRRCAIHSPAGSVMVIPRERIATGDYLTRLYVQVPELETEAPVNGAEKEDARERRGKVTMDTLFQHAVDAFRPYYIQPKEDGAVDWWAAYQIGQRVTDKFTVKDSKGINRVFIAGDGQFEAVITPILIALDTDGITLQPVIRTALRYVESLSYEPPATNEAHLGRTRHERVNDGLIQSSLETNLLHQRPHPRFSNRLRIWHASRHIPHRAPHSRPTTDRFRPDILVHVLRQDGV